ncbi:MAG: hypothetical protein OEZ65_01180 [Gemmatimonadota bacterium]|nr:hypothetical protein [Gemmatimonadota bacterium]
MRATLLLLSLALPAPGLLAQAGHPDSVRLHDAAVDAHRRFERRRLRLIPSTNDSPPGECEERVGRFCVWYDAGESIPEDDPRVGEYRLELLATLDSVAGIIPGDDWVLGQRVWYLWESGAGERARSVAASCDGAAPWWCAALEGWMLHEMERYDDAAEVFARAVDGLGAVDPEEADRWRVPRWILDSDGREALDDASEAVLPALLDRFWRLSDPLYLVPGNDRRTADLSRWTVSLIRERQRTPYQIGWAADLEQLLVRNGWELGWERTRHWDISRTDGMIGHNHPEGRDFGAPGRILRDPASAKPHDLVADLTRPRSLYAPAYAPVLLPMQGQLAVFPRGGDMTVVVTTYLSADTTVAAAKGDPRPWMDPGERVAEPDVSGVFVWNVAVPPAVDTWARGSVRTLTGQPGPGGDGLAGESHVLELPAGDYVLSAERWSPSRRRAGRMRTGLSRDTVPPDVPRLSDLLLVAGDVSGITSVREAAENALPSTRVSRSGKLGIAFEVTGLGWIPETVSFEVAVVSSEAGPLRRLGTRLGILGDEAVVSVRWEEPGPERPQPMFQVVALEMPSLDVGRYRVVLDVILSGREIMRVEKEFSVVVSDWTVVPR